MNVRTRIAPSPTGFPHIGTVYQALFDYSFAKKNKGQFLIRIEDTDRTRFVEGAEEGIYKAIDWFGLNEDESPRKDGPYKPYRQSERLDLYKKYAEELVEKNHAYYCFCTKERLDEVRKQMQAEGKVPMYDKHCRNLTKDDVTKKLNDKMSWVIRMKVPENTQIKVTDGIRGEIQFDSNIVDDQVLLKSDGFPTYHLAVVVDDHLMKISHVLRGEEWISSSPKHFLLYDFFEWEKPIFYHTPLIRNPDKSKMGKRHGHSNVAWYQEQGYLPEALLNFMALLGWSHPDQKEIFNLDELIQLFDFKDLKPVGPTFDLVKLDWMNGQYIMKMSEDDLAKHIVTYIKKYQDKDLDPEQVKRTVPLIRERIKKLSEYLTLAGFFFERPTSREADLSSKKNLLQQITNALQSMQDWRADDIGSQMLKVAQEAGVKNSDFFMTLRIAITGKRISPPLNESMELLGKDECIARITSI